jgi:hypothetical protein
LPRIVWWKRLFAKKCRSNKTRAACSAGLCFVYSYTRQTGLFGLTGWLVKRSADECGRGEAIRGMAPLPAGEKTGIPCLTNSPRRETFGPQTHRLVAGGRLASPFLAGAAVG